MMLQPLRMRHRQTVIIGLLIGAVGCLTLTPTMYLLFHALRWTGAQQVLEGVFLPLLLLSVAAYLLVYSRTKASSRPINEATPSAEGQETPHSY